MEYPRIYLNPFIKYPWEYRTQMINLIINVIKTYCMSGQNHIMHYIQLTKFNCKFLLIYR